MEWTESADNSPRIYLQSISEKVGFLVPSDIEDRMEVLKYIKLK